MSALRIPPDGSSRAFLSEMWPANDGIVGTMPLYDYQCQSCGHVAEVMHGVNASGPQNCERCGGQMRKLLSAPAIVFKGSGWAKKDARSTRPAGAAKSGNDADSNTGSSSAGPAKSEGAGRSDTKPAGADPAA